MRSSKNLTVQTRHGNIGLTDTAGDGLPIVFLHGSGSSRGVFQKQLKSALLSERRLITIDLPGHGASEDATDPGNAYTAVGLADAISDVVANLRLDRYILCGWSLGGHVAIEMMGRLEGIAGTVLVGAPPVSKGILGMLRGFHPSFDMFLASKQNYSARDVDRFLSLCFGETVHPSFRGSIARTDGRLRAVFSNAMMKGKGEDQRRVIENTHLPVALINGADDPFVRASYLSALNVPMLFEHKPLFIKNAGHAPFWEKPDFFNALLVGFLEGVDVNETERQKASERILG